MMDRSAETVLLRQEGGVAWITLNRPDRLNAFAGRMRDELHDALAQASDTAETRVIVITGAGRGFCTGADVEVMSDLLVRGDADTFAALVEAGMRVVRKLHALPQPVIAAVNGPAAGAGASLALACDLRIASETASLGITFNRIGLHPDWGATWFLPRLVGAGRAAELVMSARMVEAAEAERIGIFQRVVAAEALEGEVRKLAEEMAAKPPLALALAKRTLAESAGGELDAALAAEHDAQLRCFRSADAQEGIAAFHEKRRPVFRGE
ncbi:MAG: enoyl-CoA hydratase-related protein [Gemmatimonadota bacterium]|nr:enoyl-CoA hydratase-related protein [Gemmatimonadota bacterium]